MHKAAAEHAVFGSLLWLGKLLLLLLLVVVLTVFGRQAPCDLPLLLVLL